MCTLKLLVWSFAGQDECSLVAVDERRLQCGRAQLLVVLVVVGAECAFVRVGKGCTVEVNSHLGFDALVLYQMGDKYSLATATGSLTHSWQCPGNLVRQREETFGMYYFADSRVLWCIIYNHQKKIIG